MKNTFHLKIVKWETIECNIYVSSRCCEGGCKKIKALQGLYYISYYLWSNIVYQYLSLALSIQY